MDAGTPFAERFRSALKEKGSNFEILGDELGISAKTLSRYAKGLRLPRIDTARQIAEALEVDPLWLQGFDASESGGAREDDEAAYKSADTDVKVAASATPETPDAREQPADGGERLMLSNYRRLNPHGRAKAVAYLAALVAMFPADGDAAPRHLGGKFTPTADVFPTVQVMRSASEPSGRLSERLREMCLSFGFELAGIRWTPNVVIVSLAGGQVGQTEIFPLLCRCTAAIAEFLFIENAARTLSCFLRAQASQGETGETLAKLIVSKQAESADYAELRRRTDENYDALLQVADEYYLHPSLQVLR